MDNQDTIQSFPISMKLSDAIVTYLNERPHGEVAALVQGIRQAYQAEVTRVELQKELNKTAGVDNKPAKKEKK